MKKYLKKLTFWILTVIMVLQMVYHPITFAAATEDSLTILFTHDLHDNFLPIKADKNGTIKYQGGYAKLKSAIDLERQIDPDALLVDAGDYSMGTPFQTIFESESPELRMMGQMGYDVVTLGNHEFDYRAEGLTASLHTAIASGDPLPQIVQANMTYPADKQGNLTKSLQDLKTAMENYGAGEYTILERNGFKIGVFGIMGADSASKAPMSEVKFDDSVENAKRIVKILKEEEKVDFILCLSHSGTWEDPKDSEDEILAREVPEINVIISGHTHTKLSEPKVVGNTIIASSGSYGKNLGVVKLTMDPDSTWKLNSYEIKNINGNLAEDKNTADTIQQYKKVIEKKYFSQFNRKYDEVVARSTFSFPTIGAMYLAHGESTLGDLVSDAYIYTVKEAEGEKYIPVAAAIVPIGTIRGSILKGDITTADEFSISSLGIGADKRPGYPLISVYLTGKELKTVCEVDASITPLMEDAQLYISGMNFTFNPNRLLFNKVTDTYLVNEDGTEEEIDDSKLYRIVVGLYSAQMLSIVGDKSFGLLSIVPKTADGIAITNFEDYILYDGAGNELKEWYALDNYLQSFEKEDGVPVIPQYYAETHERKIVDDNSNFLAIISNPNNIIIGAYIVIVILIILIIAGIRKLYVWRKKRKARLKLESGGFK